ncbi:MAG: hypothetical protein GY727_13370 [Gammaproteobacteria bacterium]|nr:hypothetical protein [Gammaproteobacteria bacterium]MCP4088275.1 hypothetical protein [Gammaproteobacteria bacterium]MCP4276414.1 hypothetical protein [Gammaproteobacteria bacterium]MCP4831061.1 hypothetical protein [Gammaproteobacteria bacterium]MCP4929329.1 hypothetical protein [Gammaproteobacteria bacterium]
MQTFGLNYEVKPDRVEDFKKILADLIAEMEACDGHEQTILFADVTQPNLMMIYSNWGKKAEFADFVKSDTFMNAITKATEMLESHPSHFAGQNIRLIKPPG